MTEFLNGILSSIDTLIQLVSNFVSGIFQMLAMVQASVPMITTAVGFMPVPVLAFAIAVVTISVAYLIIGR